jgi:isopenicillin N synthase-like dioxygenase
MSVLMKTTASEAANLPLIDVSTLRTDNSLNFAKTADLIGIAAREVGFFRIFNHGIDPHLIDATYETAARFFALPDAIKLRSYIGLSSNHRGYVPFNEKGDYPDERHRRYEAFDSGLDLPADDPDYMVGNRVLGPNVWPEVEGFKEIITQYYRQISSLGRLICSALEMHLGLPAGSMTGLMSKPVSQLRLLHYVRPDKKIDQKSVNMGAHTDYECLTLLHTRNKGLQVMTQNDFWIDVPVDPTSFVVNIGDMMEAWTNGLLRSTPHRVLNLSAERFSIPYFVAADYGTVIQPFSQLVGEGQKPNYQPFIAGEHLVNMLIRDFPYLRKKRTQNVGAYPDSAAPTPVSRFEHRLGRSPF